MSVVKNIVLVHGAFADGSSWSKVIPLLQEMGFVQETRWGARMLHEETRCP
jgi:hypothetical protein